jgi:pilus assembly protein Flp/PilA
MNEFLVKAWCEVTNRWHEVRSGERGATAVEYGIMVALIAAVIIVAVGLLGDRTNDAFVEVEGGMDEALKPTG